LFLSEPEFQERQNRGEFLEWARVPPSIGFLMGSPKGQVEEALARGQDVFAQVDVQGARSIRAAMPDAVLIFLRPPDLETLQRRLVVRATEASDDRRRRLENATAELASEPEFDYSITNYDGRLEDAVEQVRAIMRNERARGATAP
jgi:guanylate kinase